MISLSSLRPHPFAHYGDFVSAIKLKALSIFGPRSLLLIHQEVEGFIGHLLDFTNLTSPQLYHLWAFWPTPAAHSSLTFIAYGKKNVRDFFALYEEDLVFQKEMARFGQDIEQLKSYFYLLRDQSIGNLVLLPELRQDIKMQILEYMPQVSFMRFTRMKNQQGKCCFLFDTLYSFFHIEQDNEEESSSIDLTVWDERAGSDTIVVSLNEDRFFHEFIREREVHEIPVLPGSRSRLRYVAVKRIEQQDKPLYISRIETIGEEMEGHGHRLYLAPKISQLNIDTKGLLEFSHSHPAYARAQVRKSGS